MRVVWFISKLRLCSYTGCGEVMGLRRCTKCQLSPIVEYKNKHHTIGGDDFASPEMGLDRPLPIEARAPANATKDQMRLMMPALLAERFQLAVHFETPEVPVLAMTLVKPGKPGTGLRPHAEGPSCDAPASPNIFPATCYLAGQQFADGGQRKGSGRDLTMADIAGYLPSWGNLDRPLIDRTGLTGEYDFTVQWKPDPNVGGGRAIPKMGSGPVVPPAPASEPDSDGPSFTQALRNQLGLRLVSIRAPIETLVIDHVERPSEN